MVPAGSRSGIQARKEKPGACGAGARLVRLLPSSCRFMNEYILRPGPAGSNNAGLCNIERDPVLATIPIAVFPVSLRDADKVNGVSH